MVEVVNMRTCNPPWGQPGDVRIDRATPWGNPFPITDTENRSQVLLRYAIYMRCRLDSGTLNIKDLANAKRLGCWCKPLPCHGDFLKKEIEDYLKKQQTTLNTGD